MNKPRYHLVYWRPRVYSGPIIKSAERKGNEIVVGFDHVGGGLVGAKGEALREFQVKGRDKKGPWVDAPARIVGATVVVDVSGAGGDTSELAYGFNKTPTCDLRNAESLPASPFSVPVPFVRGKTAVGEAR